MQWRVTLWVMAGAQAITSASFSISIPFLPLFIQQMGVHPASAVALWSGAVQSTTFITGAIAAPHWGSLADRVGRRAMVVRSAFFGGLTSALMGASFNVWELMGARVLMGMFGGFNSAASALVASEVPENVLGFSLGWMATAQMAGILIGPLAGGAIADLLHDYRAVFFLTCAGVWVAALVVARFVPEAFAKPAPNAPKRPPILAQVREIVRRPAMAPMLVVLMLAQVTTLALQPIAPLYVEQMVSGSAYVATFAGAAFALVGLGNLVSAPFLGNRSDRIGYRKVLLISTLGAGLFTIPQAFVHNVWAFLALRFLVGLFLGGILPTANAWIGRLFPPDQRGTVYGIAYSASFVGMFLGPNVGGLVAALYGAPAVFAAVGVVMLVNTLWIAVGVRSQVAAAD